MARRSRRERKADERAFARIYLSVLGLGLAALMLVLMARHGSASVVTGVIAAFGIALAGFALFATDGAVDRWADRLGGDEAGLPALLVAIPIYWLRKRLRGGQR
jgi:uncharacterized membrane protein (DUF4010 family)